MGLLPTYRQQPINLGDLYFNTPPPAQMQAARPTLTQRAGDVVSSVARKVLPKLTAQRLGDAVGYTPLGAITGGFDAGADLRKGNYLAGTLGAVANLLPDVGPAAKGMFAHAMIAPAMEGPFRRWFNGSKIVDRTGVPLPVYHGTKSDFSAFDIGHFGAGDEGLLGKGFYFTYNPEEASSYALRDLYGKGDSPNVVPAYLSIQNPLMITNGRLPDGRSVIKDIHKRGIHASGGAAIRQIADDAGHDGIIWTTSEGGVGHVVAFRPEQIKSAIGNHGSYSPLDADLTK